MTHFLAFGDSITYGAGDPNGGWVERLRARINARKDEHRVYNLGVSGDTSTALVKRFKSECSLDRLSDDEPNVIFIAIGTNDSALEKKKPVVPLPTYCKNLRKIVMQARKITPYVFVLTPLPVDESRTAPIPWRPAWSYTNSSISKFAAANATEAMRAGAILIDVARKFTPNKNQELLIDGVHPSKNGYDAMFQEIYQTLQQNKLVNL